MLKEEYIFLISVQQSWGKWSWYEESALMNLYWRNFEIFVRFLKTVLLGKFFKWWKRNIFSSKVYNSLEEKDPGMRNLLWGICTDGILRYSSDSSKLSYWGNFLSGERGIYFPQKCTTFLRKKILVWGICFEESIWSTLLKKNISINGHDFYKFIWLVLLSKDKLPHICTDRINAVVNAEDDKAISTHFIE